VLALAAEGRLDLDPRTFYVPGLDLMVGFAKGPDGAPERIHAHTNFDERWGARAFAAARE
jgi:hypothetical protein